MTVRYFRSEWLKQRCSLAATSVDKLLCHHGTFLEKIIRHFKICQKGSFQWMKNSMLENPQGFPAFDPCESAMEPGGQITCWIGFSEVLSWLVAAGRPTLLGQQTKGRAVTTIGMGGDFFLTQWWVQSWIGSGWLNCVPHWFSEWGPTGVRVQQHLTWAVGKGEHGARTTCLLPSHPRCPLTSPRDGPPVQGWQDEKGCMGGKRRESGDEGGREGCTSGIDKDVREINLQRNKKFLSSFTYCARPTFSRG